LDRRDARLVERLIRVRQRTEVPESVFPDGIWFALPTADQDAVLRAFGLRDPVPVTMRMGMAAWLRTWREFNLCGAVYVSPVLNGWTWCVAADGLLVAHNEHDFFDADPSKEHLAELAEYLDDRDPGGERRHRSADWRFPAWLVATRLSASPHDFDAETRVEGVGVLALSSAAGPQARQKGALPV
jgi:hypothetical protein